MKRFLLTIFGSRNKKEVIVNRPLLSTIGYQDIHYRCKRGYLAKQIALYMNYKEINAEKLYHLSFTQTSFRQSENEILHFSELMLKWSEQGVNVPSAIQELSAASDMKNALLKAYHVHKKELLLQEDVHVQNEVVQNEKWSIYRDVLYAASQRKIRLIELNEVNFYKTGEVFCEYIVQKRSDVPVGRNMAKEYLEQKGYGKRVLTKWLLVISEAITNIIKHAQEGKMTLIDDEENHEIRLVVEDKGPGFSLEDLPNATLLAGYSTKRSLGQGFTLIMKIAHQIMLCNTPEGATLIIVFKKEPVKEESGYLPVLTKKEQPIQVICSS